MSVSVPFRRPSEQLGAAQRWSSPQMPLEQSRLITHFLLGVQGAQMPPQSTSVSPGPSKWSSQEIDWQIPFTQL
jgi:hypothetical protein